MKWKPVLQKLKHAILVGTETAGIVGGAVGFGVANGLAITELRSMNKTKYATMHPIGLAEYIGIGLSASVIGTTGGVLCGMLWPISLTYAGYYLYDYSRRKGEGKQTKLNGMGGD